MRHTLFIVLAVSLLISRTSFAQIHWTAADNIQNEITNHSTLVDGVYRLHDGDYRATDTATGSSDDPWSGTNPFIGKLAVGNSVLNFEGMTPSNLGLLIDGEFSLSNAGSLNASGTNGGIGLCLAGDFVATDAVTTARGDGYFRYGQAPEEIDLSIGILTKDGDFRMNGGTLYAEGTNYGLGMFLENGDFLQHGGQVVVRTTPDAQQNCGEGIVLLDGNYTVENGTLDSIGCYGFYALGLVDGDFTATNATITATGDGYLPSPPDDDSYGRGIMLYKGNFRMNGGTLDATGSDYGEGITLQEGNFIQTGGRVTAKGIAGQQGLAGQGIVILNGNYTVTDGEVNADGEFGNAGILLDHGDFTANGATISAYGNGFADFPGLDQTFSSGILVGEGDFRMNGGTLDSLGTDFAAGVKLYDGNFVQNGGLVVARGILGSEQFPGQGIHLYVGNYELANGSLHAVGENGGFGVFVPEGDFIAENATVSAFGDGNFESVDYGEHFGRGITVYFGNYRMTGGTLEAVGTDYGEGVTVENGNFVQNGGRVLATGTTGKLGLFGQGIILENGDYLLTDGVLDARSDADGTGLQIDNGDFVVNNGTVSGETRNTIQGGAAIYVENHFDMRSGVLRLMPGDMIGYAAVAGTSSFGKDSILRLDIDRNGIPGIMATMFGTTIADGAKLELGEFDSVALKKNGTVGGVFLHDILNGIRGTFDGPESTLTLDIKALKSADRREYRLAITRTAYASDYLDGNNRAVARSMERNLPSVLENPKARPLVDAYSAMDRAENVSEIADIARGLTPWQATMYAGMLVNLTDSGQFGLSRNIDALRRQRTTGCDPCEAASGCVAKNPWQGWFSGHGNFARYDAASDSYSDLDLDAWGIRAGLGRKVDGLGRNTVFGAAFDYTHGKIDGSRTDTDFDSYGFLAAIRTDLRRKLWGELVAGYSYARFDQGRYDYSDTRHDSKVDDHLFRLGMSLGRDYQKGNRRLTPIAGLDYMLVHQKGYTESNLNGLGLNVGGDDLNSLRLRLGGEVEWRRGKWSLAAHGFYRYEFLDRYALLDSWFSDVPEVGFASCGPNIGRSSGVLGGRLDWALSKRTTTYVSYDFTVGDRYDEHWVNLGLRRIW